MEEPKPRKVLKLKHIKKSRLQRLQDRIFKKEMKEFAELVAKAPTPAFMQVDFSKVENPALKLIRQTFKNIDKIKWDFSFLD